MARSSVGDRVANLEAFATAVALLVRHYKIRVRSQPDKEPKPKQKRTRKPKLAVPSNGADNAATTEVK